MSKEKHTEVMVDDRSSIAWLLLLYTLQGIPMGLCASIPLILKEKGASYEALSLFSLVSIPFSLKILWAPIVDTYFLKGFGRRKSWIVPVQFLTGFLMIAGSSYVRSWLSEDNLMVSYLTGYFLLLYFFMATQDIAVDGWALTMLSRENVGWASISNAIGQTVGVFVANQGFIALSDEKWCKDFLGVTTGPVLDLPGFMVFWGVVFVISTLFLWILKKEEDVHEKVETLYEACRNVSSICSLSNVLTLLAILLTCKIAYSPLDSALIFKLQENGMPKADLATYSPLFVAVSLMVPALASKFIASYPLDSFYYGITLKMLVAIGSLQLLGATNTAYSQPDGPSGFYKFYLVAYLLFNDAVGTLVFSSAMSFYSRISDPSIGGTYMTLLNTTSNWGHKWPSVLSLWLIPKLTFSHCEITANNTDVRIEADCSLNNGQACKDIGGVCKMDIDGYTSITIICFFVGLLWVRYFRKELSRLQSLPHSDWLIPTTTQKNI